MGYLEHGEDISIGMGTPPSQEYLEPMEDMWMGTPPSQEHLKHGHEDGDTINPEASGAHGGYRYGDWNRDTTTLGHLEPMKDIGMGLSPPQGHLKHMGTGTGPPRTLHQEVDNAAGNTKAVGGHAVVGTLVAHVGTGDGDDGAIGTDLHIVCARRSHQHQGHPGDGIRATLGTTIPWKCWPGPIRQVMLTGRAPSWMRHLKVASSPGATAMLCGSMEMMGLCRPAGTTGNHEVTHVPCTSPGILPCPMAALTVAGAVPGGDGDGDGGLAGHAARVSPAHVLPRIGHRELGQAQARPRHLGTRWQEVVASPTATVPRPITSPHTWCLAGRDPPRLYQVMVACPCPATTQSRSRVCPSVTEDAEDSMRMGDVTPVAVGQGEG